MNNSGDARQLHRLHRPPWRHWGLIAALGLLAGGLLTLVTRRVEFFFGGIIWFAAIASATAIVLLARQFSALHKSNLYYRAASNLTYQLAFVLMSVALADLLLIRLAKGRSAFLAGTSLAALASLADRVAFLAIVLLLAGVISMLIAPFSQPMITAWANHLGMKPHTVASILLSYFVSFCLIALVGVVLAKLFWMWL